MQLRPNQKRMALSVPKGYGERLYHIHFVNTGSQPVKPKVVAFTGKDECQKYSQAVWNFIIKEQQMQERKLYGQNGIKPAMKQTSPEARISALEAQLRVSSQPEECDVKKKWGETLEEPAWGRNRGNPALNCQALGSKCKEMG